MKLSKYEEKQNKSERTSRNFFILTRILSSTFATIITLLSMFWEKLKLDFECERLPLKLLTSQWQNGERSKSYVWYRWIIAMFYAFSFINSVISSIRKNETTIVMFIFLSRWNLLGTFIATTLGAYLSTRYYYNRSKMEKGNVKKLAFYWFLYNNSVVIAMVISIVYWTALSNEHEENDLNNVLMHITNSLVLLVDILIIQHPYRFSHIIYPMFCCTLYALFTLIYPFAGGVDHLGRNFVYPVLDWKTKPRQSLLVACGSVLSVSIMHIIICIIHMIRVKIFDIFVKSKKMFTDQALPIIHFK
ncbi:CLUMA_CG019934, isoform A [Clunio marinus]|uniref:CLUMA_CG019934, isoform A n=1 Tax=Clunio marinus TaxID=568069 RepID=A0A1J1J3R4_9DIPT|nr:CLUMA_CG019934, isoform A [Clunio marinus]